jgi:purine-binding chemotaxis protein CheW
MSAKHVCFWVAQQRFAVPIEQIKETITLRPITRVFLTPRWVAGIMNLRGDVVAVVDLAAFLDLPSTPHGPDTRVLLARAGQPPRAAGFIVDRLMPLAAIDRERVQPIPPTVAPEIAELGDGVATLEGGEPLLLLDLARVLGDARLKQFERSGPSP